MALSDQRPVVAFCVLLAAALVKGLAAAVPILVERTQRGRRRRVGRAASWLGGVFLVGYGGAVAAVSWAVLADVISPNGPIDRRGLAGHAFIWDPMFAIWGVLLLAGLWLTRTPR